MKIRQGFISNSSSTSFIIAIRKGGEPCKNCGSGKVISNDFLETIEQSSEYNSKITCRNKKEVLCRLKKQIDLVKKYSPESPEVEAITYDIKKIEGYDPETYDIVQVKIGYYNSIITEAISAAEKLENIKIIREEEG